MRPAVALAALALIATPAAARDRGADGRFSSRGSSHFRLLQDVDIDRYHGAGGSREFEREVLERLEIAYRRVGDAIGLRPRAKVQVVVYDAAVFDAQFSELFGFRTAGFFDGVMHVRGSTQVDLALAATLSHEYTHAAVHAFASDGLFPAWLNEGLAEYFEALELGRRRLTPRQYAGLVQARQTGRWIPLASLSMPSFAHMGGGDASLAYLESFAVVEHLVRRKGERRLGDLCEQLLRTRNPDRALDRVYKKTLAEIEADLLAELR